MLKKKAKRKDKTVGVVLPADLHDRLVADAKKQDRKTSALIRLILAQQYADGSFAWVSEQGAAKKSRPVGSK